VPAEVATGATAAVDDFDAALAAAKASAISAVSAVFEPETPRQLLMRCCGATPLILQATAAQAIVRPPTVREARLNAGVLFYGFCFEKPFVFAPGDVGTSRPRPRSPVYIEAIYRPVFAWLTAADESS
jgi:hypothetical protein